MVVELFDIWGIDFVGPFGSSNRKNYVLLIVDYVSKWVEIVVLPYNVGRSIIIVLQKNVFSRFGTPWAIVSDEGSHFYNKLFRDSLEKYKLRYSVATPHHPQTSRHI